MSWEDHEKAGFTWVDHNLVFRPKTRGARFYGVCAYSKRVAKIALDSLTVMIVRDTMINPKAGECEETTRCLDFDCPLNRGTIETVMRADYGRKRVTAWMRKDGGRPRMAVNRTPEGELADWSEWVAEPGSVFTARKS
jgi:hypothetical protein